MDLAAAQRGVGEHAAAIPSFQKTQLSKTQAHMDLAAAQRGVGEHGDGVQRVCGVVKLHNAAAAGPPIRVLRAGTGSMRTWVRGGENRAQCSAGLTTPQGIAGQAAMQRHQSSFTGVASCDTSPGGAGRALKQALRMGAELGDTFTQVVAHRQHVSVRNASRTLEVVLQLLPGIRTMSPLIRLY